MPDRPDPDPRDPVSRLRHDVRAALLVPMLRGQLLRQTVAQMPGVLDADRELLLEGLDAIDAALRNVARIAEDGPDVGS